MSRISVMLARTASVGVLVLTAACGGTGDGTSAPSGQPPEISATIMVAMDARLGGHLVDGTGRSLYYFAKDVPASGSQAAVSNCNADCLAMWPVFDASSVVVQGIDATDVDRVTRSDGTEQTTYKGFPLYYNVGDTQAGESKGEGVNGLWYVVHEPSYSIALLSKANEAATYLTDGAGRALYTFARDITGTSTMPPASACTSASCVASWPVFRTDQVTAPSDLSAADFTVYTRADGARQSAYRGNPLYYYFGDTAPGETNGRAVPDWQTIDPTAP